MILDDQHISFTTTKLGSLTQVTQSKDPEGLRVFYYLVQVSLSAPHVHARLTNAAWSAWTTVMPNHPGTVSKCFTIQMKALACSMHAGFKYTTSDAYDRS